MIGYDLDGVICENSPKRSKPFFEQNSEERAKHKIIRLEHCLNGKLIFKPKGDFIIATARKTDEEKAATLSWLKKNKINPATIYFLKEAKTRENIIKFKADIINSLELTEFTDDDPKIVARLTKLCEKTNVKLYGAEK